MSSSATASGIQRSGNWDFRSSRQPIEARFEIGEVLLTASIFEALSYLLLRVMTRYFALSQESRELMPGDSGQFRGVPKRQDALGIERDAKLSPQTRFHLRLWKQQAASTYLHKSA